MDKAGLDYFYFPCHNSVKMQLIECKFKHIGFFVYVKLLQYIYGHEGYYLDFENDCVALYCNEFNVSRELLCNLIEFCLDNEIFDRSMFESYKILTSDEIQANYLEAVGKYRSSNIKKEYRLSTANEYCERFDSEETNELKRLFEKMTNKSANGVWIIPKRVNMQLLIKKVLESDWLMNAKNMNLKQCINHYTEIINGNYSNNYSSIRNNNDIF